MQSMSVIVKKPRCVYEKKQRIQNKSFIYVPYGKDHLFFQLQKKIFQKSSELNQKKNLKKKNNF